MTTVAIKATLGADLGEGKFSTSFGPAADTAALASTADTSAGTLVTDAAAYAALAVTFAAALAVLVSDGASPTQAHVTTANSAYTALAASYSTLSTDITAAKAATAAAKAATAGDIVLIVNQATVTTKNAITALLRGLLHRIPNWGIVT